MTWGRGLTQHFAKVPHLERGAIRPNRIVAAKVVDLSPPPRYYSHRRYYMQHLCECGCGKATSLAKTTNAGRGLVKGQPLRFRKNHSRIRSEEDRFWGLVDRRDQTGCWWWLGALRSGYGCFRLSSGKVIGAHQYSYSLTGKQVPSGLVLDHGCNQRSCVNPAHLTPRTCWENTLRATTPNPAVKNSRKDLCEKGHHLSGNNLIPKGARGGRTYRKCRVCYNNDRIAWRAKRKAAGHPVSRGGTRKHGGVAESG